MGRGFGGREGGFINLLLQKKTTEEGAYLRGELMEDLRYCYLQHEAN